MWLTPMTNMGVSSLEGAPMTTCLAPASMWPWHSSLLRCLPVHSQIYSAPTEAQGMSLTSRAVNTWMALPSMTSSWSVQLTSPGNLPWTESYRII